MKLIVIGLALLGLLAGCEVAGPTTPDNGEMRDLTPQEQQLVSASSRFGLDLFREINKEKEGESVFISPLSVSMALGMTLNGAAGETRTAMEEALRVRGLSAQEINEAYRSLIDLLQGLDPKVVFEVANSIWVRQGFPVEAPFKETNARYFEAVISELDFGSASAVDRINGWVAEKTHDKIEEIIDQIGPDVVMYLINAIYFKGTWTFEFDKKLTTPQNFTRADGTVQSVQMMHQQGTFPYAQADSYQAIDLPYGDGEFSMTVVLPAAGVDVDALVQTLDVDRWNTLVASLKDTIVTLGVPKFKLERKYESEMKEALTALGMGIAFSDMADFSKISGGRDLLISRVIHKTYVEVDEEGTEAAAVTAVEMIETSAGPQPIQMIVDRPFVFALRERASGTILFIGKMATI